MGFLKKIFKPVAKVLDKIIPNEIKPALPYLAAFAPVFGPTAGMFGSTIGKRMLLSGGANILGQLSQEGNEGDINLLSAGLGALTGAMTTPDAAKTFQGMKTPTGNYKGVVDGVADTVIKRPELSLLDKAKNVGLDSLAKGSEILRPDGAIPNLFSKEGAKAALLPASTATGDVMQAEARQLEKQAAIDAALEQAELIEDSGARAQAIRNAMLSYGFFTDEEIDSTISSAGYKEGGRVGLQEGGVLSQILPQANQITAISQRPSLGNFQPLQQAEAVFPRLNQLEQGVNTAEQDLGRIRDRLGNEPGTLASMAFQRPLGLQPAFQPLNMLNLNRGSGISALQSGPEAQGMKDGGMMDLGGKEMDMRGGGFIPIGKKERADDVPARLSKNEFVMTADAVRAAGGGSVNEGAKRMYKVMNDLEARA